MKHFFNKIFIYFNLIKSNIAFYPTILAVLGFLFSIFMIYLEQKGISKYLIESFPVLVVENGDTALTVLSACIGGLISMMVFSFSMVMLLLSQASSNFSPRLLPGLISDKRNQIILGIYLAAIIYCIFTMFSIEPTNEKYTLPGFAVLLGIAFTVLCLCFFIYFIHNMSQSIQISNIVDGIYEKAKTRLHKIIERQGDCSDAHFNNFDDMSQWYAYPSHESGYFQNLSIKNILAFCKEHQTKIYIKIPKGMFVLTNSDFILSEKELDEKQRHLLYESFNFSRSELVEDNYVLAFKQLTEIAVKAMSPGINDPGTAINAIDYITELFQLRMKIKDLEILVNGEGDCFKIAIISFEELLYQVMTSLRTYCKHDPIIVQKLLRMLNYLEQQPAESKGYLDVLEDQKSLLLKVATKSLDTEMDIEIITQLGHQ